MRVENKAMSDRQWSEFIFKMILNSQEGSGLTIKEKAGRKPKLNLQIITVIDLRLNHQCLMTVSKVSEYTIITNIIIHYN